MTAVVITGLGLVTAAGGDTASTWRSVLEGRSCAQSWPDLAAEGFPVTVACRVVDADLTRPEQRGRGLAVKAAREALADSGLLGHDDGLVEGAVPASRVGVFVGTTMGESAVFEAAAATGAFELDEGAGPVFARHVAQRFGAKGVQRTFGTACAAGNYAIGAAARAVSSGRVDIALAGGVEPFSRIAMLGFARMRAMAPGGCRPFASDRRGMTLGEGAGFAVLESPEHAARRGAKALARVGGLGLAADAHHPTAPLDDGRGMAAAMRAGLAATGVSAGEVGWVSAHGTGTPRSDAAEAKALHAVFGGAPPPVSSVKGALGHSLGAATAVEAVLSVCALRDGVLPPNVGGPECDPVLGLDLVVAPRPAPSLAWVMSCGYAFGGLNSALLLGRP